MNGLPVIMPNGIGDDSSAVKANSLGICLDTFQVSTDQVNQLLNLVEQSREHGQIRSWALEHRTFDQVALAYREVTDALS